MVELLKKYIIVVVSGVIALLAIVGIVLGVANFSRAQEKLEEAKKEADRISILIQGVPVETTKGGSVRLVVNEDLLKQIREIRRAEKEQSYQVLRDALRFNIGYDPSQKTIKRKPLIEGIFPRPQSGAGALPFEFPRAYRNALSALLGQLNAGGPPTEQDAANEQENLAQSLGFHADQAAGDKSTKRQGAAPTGAGGVESGLTEEARKRVARQQAAIKRAEAIKIYATMESLDVVDPALTTVSGMAPSEETMWWAQVSLWLQQDLVSAVAQVNASAANVLESAVKQIDKLRIQHGCYYSLAEGDTNYRGIETELKVAEGFVPAEPTEFYDVVPFNLDVVVDLRRLPLLIDAIYRQGHYLLCHWELESVESSEWIEDGTKGQKDKERDLYRYGPDPVARVTMYWQAFLMRDFYRYGIIGYGTDAQVRPTVTLYNGQTIVLENSDQREGVKGLALMPEVIRKDLSGLEETGSTARRGRRR